MQKQSRLPLIAVASSILLPYGVVITDTVAMTTNQFWLFPLWAYLPVFSNWMGFGFVIPPFLPSFPLLPSVMGLLWCILGLYASRLLHQFYAGQRDAKSVWLSTLKLLILQIIVTIIAGFIVWGYGLLLVVPLPLHFLIVLFLLRMQVQKVNLE